MGIAALGARKKLLLAAEELLEAVEVAAGGSGSGGSSEGGKAEPREGGQREGGQRWQQQDGGQGGEGAAAVQQTAQQRAAAAYRELLYERRESNARASASGVGNWRTLAAGGGRATVASCDILQYFKPVGGGKQRQVPTVAPNPGSILSYLHAPDGSALVASAPAAGAGRGRGGKQPAAQQWAHKAVAAGGGGGKRGWGPR